MIADLVCDGPDGGSGAGVCKGGVDFFCGLDIVYVVEGEGFFFGEGEAGPDYGVGLDWWDEEG